jgi:hypothetical protein
MIDPETGETIFVFVGDDDTEVEEVSPTLH